MGRSCKKTMTSSKIPTLAYTAAAVPLTLATVLVIMLFTGRVFDRITLGALIIALGLLVADAIIAIEIMVVKLEEGLDRIAAASYAWSHTAALMLAGTLVTTIGMTVNGLRHPRISNQPAAVPARNGHAVSAIPATVNPSAWLRSPIVQNTSTQTMSANRALSARRTPRSLSIGIGHHIQNQWAER